MNHWLENEAQTYLAIPRLASPTSSKLPAPEAVQRQMVTAFEALPQRPDLVPLCNAILQAWNHIEMSPATVNEIVELLTGVIQQSLETTPADDPRNLFSFGMGLRALSQLGKSDSLDLDVWPRILSLADTFGALPSYLEAVLQALSIKPDLASSAELEPFADVLIGNLHSPSHALRKPSLEILAILRARPHSRQTEILDTMLAIDDSPIDLQSARSLSMHVRRLATHVEVVASGGWLQKAVTHYCFGLLTFKLSQLWADAVDVIREICRDTSGGEVVVEIVRQFLEELPISSEVHEDTGNDNTKKQTFSNFECSNLVAVESCMLRNQVDMKDASRLIESAFYAIHRREAQTPPDAPALALRILLGVPHVAEKHSRQLVPLFLRSVSTDKAETGHVSLSAKNAASDYEEGNNWQAIARKERKMMLDLFGCFTNPKVLYRSQEVFEALKIFLANGDVDVQRSALKALLTWKIPGIEPYEENLTNLLDDARFRDEIAVFVIVDSHGSTIRDEHRKDLMPILLRILFGRVIARSGSGSRTGQVIKRKAILGALSHFGKGDLRSFVEITLGPLAGIELIKNAKLDEYLLNQEFMSVRKQLGLLNMMKDLLDTLGSQFAPLMNDLVEALLYCTVRAARSLSVGFAGAAFEAPGNYQASLLKDVRHIGLHCLTMAFEHAPAQIMQPYLPTIFAELVSPRLESLPTETAQSVSGLLRLFATWSSDREMIFFLSNYDRRVLRSVIDCLVVPSAKPAVKLFVLDNIIKEIARLAGSPAGLDHRHSPNVNDTVQSVLSPHLEYILRTVGKLIQESPSNDLLDSSIELVSTLACIVQDSTETRNMLEISVFLLEQPPYRVKPKSKGDILGILQQFVPISDLHSIEGLHDRLFRTVSSLFGYFKDRPNRQTLLKVLHTLTEEDSELRGVADLCSSLNSYAVHKLDEPDFEQRQAAFSALDEAQSNSYTPRQWLPILYNMLFFVRNKEELAIRSNAALTLRRFVEVSTFRRADGQESAFPMLDSVLLPALRKGVSEPSELVRSEYLSIMAHVVRCNPDWEKTSDMYVLLANGDEEASFFGNILHIQHHRRLRALRRLAGEARKGKFRPLNVAHFFIPLVEHFIFDEAEEESAYNLSAESITTISALTLSLEWPQYRALLRRYIEYIQSKPELEKKVIKLVGKTIDALSEASPTSAQQRILDAQQTSDMIPFTLASTSPRQEKLSDDIIKNLLPSLRQYLHEKDESTVSLRIPVAVSAVKLLKLLPPDMLKEHLPSILTDVCNILRSRAQESRDLTRKTLLEISTLIGPSSFGFVLKELRSSLAKGYQLHVLSFTMHAMLVATADIFKPGELDYCVSQMISIIMDDIFGATGEEKDAEDYISKMREVKSSKSFDSMELVAKITSIDSFVHLLRPLQSLLQEKLDSKMVKKIDELLRRIGVGLLRNQAINDRRVLIFCHELIREVYKFGAAPLTTNYKEDRRTQRFLVKMKGAASNGVRGSTSSYGYKLARFSFDVLRALLHKYDVLQSPGNVAGFIPIIGDAVVQPNEEIQTSALRLLLTIIKVPLVELDKNAGIYVAESVKIIKAATSINSELAQAALKLVSAILRERRHIEIRESDLAYLLKRLIPDLDEPDRQGVIFGFLKALLVRKVVITEIYEVMDTVAAIMVTNHTKGARDLARSVYFQFIMDYPQGKGRFTKQLAFLSCNLEYKYQEGRQSIMEAIHLLLSKVGQDIAQEVIDTIFVPLFRAIVNDESIECREMASVLIKITFEKADMGRTKSFLAMLKLWLGQLEQPLLVRAALHVYGLYLESAGERAGKEAPGLMVNLSHLLKTALRSCSEANWELLYVALQTFSKVCQVSPAAAFAASSAPLWALVRQCLDFRQAWVKLSASELLGVYFADFARSNADDAHKKLPLKGSGGLFLNGEEILEIAIASLRILRVPTVSAELAAQSVRNLVFVSKAMGQLPMESNKQSHAEVQDGEDTGSEEGDGDQPKQNSLTVTQFVLERASAIVRRGPATSTISGLTSLKAALQLIGALCNHLSVVALMPSAQRILLPLHNLTDPSIPAPHSADEAFNTTYKDLISNGTEIMSLLQKKLGTTEYISILNNIRSLVKEKREGRRVKRRIGAVAEPERAGKLKQRKGEKKREKRKEKSGEQRGRRRGW